MVGPVAHSKHTSLLLGWPIPSRFSPQASEGWDTLLPARHALTPLTPFTLSPLWQRQEKCVNSERGLRSQELFKCEVTP